LHSSFFRAVSLAFDLFLFRTETDPEYALRNVALANGRNNVDDGLRLLKTLSVEDGFGVLIAIWPNFSSTSISDEIGHPPWPGDPRLLYVEGLAARLGLPTVRLSSLFPPVERGQNPRFAYTIGDGMHPNPQGARMTADLLFPFVARALARAGP
jgi:hypothetical protein